MIERFETGTLSVNMYIGIDIGGTNIRLTSVKDLNSPILENKKQLLNSHSFKTNMQNIQSYLDNLDDKINGIGISIPGNIDKNKTMVADADNVPEFIGKPIKEMLAKKYKCKVVLDNDGVIMARGEAIYGQKGKTDFMYLIWGTGMGGASVEYKNGVPKVTKLERHKDTNLASWENVCGGKSIEKLYGKHAGKLNQTEWQEVMKQFLDNLSKFVSIKKPKMIIFGGGIAVNHEARISKIAGKLPLSVKITTFGHDAGLYGALAFLKE